MDLLDAFAALTVDATLDIAGEGELDEKLQRRAHVLGLGERVTFLGGQSQAQIAERMRAADVFVLSSRFENLPVVLLEASATRAADRRHPRRRRAGDRRRRGRRAGRAAAARRAGPRDRGRRGDAPSTARRWPRAPAAKWGIESIAATWDEIYASLSAGSTRSATVR